MPSYVDVAPASRTASFAITTSRVSAKTTVHVYAYFENSVSTVLTLNP